MSLRKLIETQSTRFGNDNPQCEITNYSLILSFTKEQRDTIINLIKCGKKFEAINYIHCIWNGWSIEKITKVYNYVNLLITKSNTKVNNFNEIRLIRDLLKQFNSQGKYNGWPVEKFAKYELNILIDTSIKPTDNIIKERNNWKQELLKNEDLREMLFEKMVTGDSNEKEIAAFLLTGKRLTRVNVKN